MSGSVKERRDFADYLNVGTTETPEYELMGAGFSQLDESPSAQTSSKRYVNDANATKRVTSYDDSFPYTTDMIRSEKAVDFICEIGELRKTGVGAETDYVRVDLGKLVSGGTGEFEARKFRVAVEVANFTDNDGEMSADGNLLPIGSMVVGKFNKETKTFTPEV